MKTFYYNYSLCLDGPMDSRYAEVILDTLYACLKQRTIVFDACCGAGHASYPCQFSDK